MNDTCYPRLLLGGDNFRLWQDKDPNVDCRLLFYYEYDAPAGYPNGAWILSLPCPGVEPNANNSWSRHGDLGFPKTAPSPMESISQFTAVLGDEGAMYQFQVTRAAPNDILQILVSWAPPDADPDDAQFYVIGPPNDDGGAHPTTPDNPNPNFSGCNC